MATGDALDILERVKRLIPGRWFAWVAPLRDGVIGGLADCAANLYAFVIYARKQTRLATATGIWLDILCYDYLRRHLLRQGRSDDVFRAIIQATILQERVTRKGVSSAVTGLINIPPFIFEPWNTNDAGGYRAPNIGYGITAGWGSLQYPAQVFMRISRSGLGPTGVPFSEGWYGGQGTPAIGAYGQGAIQYTDSDTAEIGVTDADIYQVITNSKPTGVTVWVQLGAGTVISQAPAIPPGGIGPTLPIAAIETNPHFIASYRPAAYARRLPVRFNYTN
jgi:hypothetical protein